MRCIEIGHTGNTVLRSPYRTTTWDVLKCLIYHILFRNLDNRTTTWDVLKSGYIYFFAATAFIELQHEMYWNNIMSIHSTIFFHRTTTWDVLKYYFLMWILFNIPHRTTTWDVLKFTNRIILNVAYFDRTTTWDVLKLYSFIFAMRTFHNRTTTWDVLKCEGDELFLVPIEYIELQHEMYWNYVRLKYISYVAA